MNNQKDSSLIEYLIAAFLGGILTGPGGLFLSGFIFFLLSRSKGSFIYKSKWALWTIFGIVPFILTSYPSFVLSRNNIFTEEVKRSLNNQALKCKISELDSREMRSKISPGNALYKTYIPKAQNECVVYKSQPINFKSGLRSIFFWNRNLDVTWFQIEINPITREVKKLCGDSSKIGCEEGNTW